MNKISFCQMKLKSRTLKNLKVCLKWRWKLLKRTSCWHQSVTWVSKCFKTSGQSQLYKKYHVKYVEPRCHLGDKRVCVYIFTYTIYSLFIYTIYRLRIIRLQSCSCGNPLMWVESCQTWASNFHRPNWCVWNSKKHNSQKKICCIIIVTTPM